MQTDVRALNSVDYVLDLTVPAEDLQPQITAALKRQRAQMNLKGFRPGKVPMNVVRKMVGPQVAVEVAEQAIGEAYRTAVVEPGEIEPLGQPRLVELDFDAEVEGAPLKATVQFGVRPEFGLADLDGVPVTRLVREFSDEDVDADLQRRRDLAATEEDAPEGTAIGPDHIAVIDIQPVDEDGEPTGPKQNAAQIVMANPDLRAEMKEVLTGLTTGDETAVELAPLEPGDDGEMAPVEGADPDRYRLTVVDVLERAVPEVDADFIKSQTNGESESLDDLKVQIREDLERSWNARARQAMEQRMVEEFVLAHRDVVPVPETLTEAALDAMLEETKQKAQGQLPPTFEVDAWRDQNRQQAEDQVRWLLVKDRLVEDEGIEVTNEDFEAEFATLASDGADLDLVKQYFTAQPQLMEQMGDQLLNRRIFGALEGRFTIVDKTREDLEREAAERRKAQEDAPVELTPDFSDEADADDALADDASADEPAESE
ncbi:trigger factor [Rubrivirga sp. S365]|uniref:Trigger factor n=1 Tax=Rubrivirga litoralis TaxID=3075598 RepID=A0ABU3BUS0_9BACT|nr:MULTISPECIES: trigger factor [unclassified Rubrivirga]MDT0633042.1 trigger factor [Rubrivirga sp. F394]MDT7856210.1 trigger factor [Rubrivirga sp. S365]